MGSGEDFSDRDIIHIEVKLHTEAELPCSGIKMTCADFGGPLPGYVQGAIPRPSPGQGFRVQDTPVIDEAFIQGETADRAARDLKLTSK